MDDAIKSGQTIYSMGFRGVKNLANNQLKDLPSGFSKLKNLKTLILTGNQMEKATIEKLKTMMPQTQIYF